MSITKLPKFPIFSESSNLGNPYTLFLFNHSLKNALFLLKKWFKSNFQPLNLLFTAILPNLKKQMLLPTRSMDLNYTNKKNEDAPIWNVLICFYQTTKAKDIIYSFL
jgi:hypothetical protein